MRPSLMRRSIPRLMLVGALVALGGPESLACSGPEAARTIQRSELIGWSFAGISIAIVAGGASKYEGPTVARRTVRRGILERGASAARVTVLLA